MTCTCLLLSFRGTNGNRPHYWTFVFLLANSWTDSSPNECWNMHCLTLQWIYFKGNIPISFFYFSVRKVGCLYASVTHVYWCCLFPIFCTSHSRCEWIRWQFIKNLACCYGIHRRFCDLCVSKRAFSFTQCSKVQEKCGKIASKTL